MSRPVINLPRRPEDANGLALDQSEEIESPSFSTLSANETANYPNLNLSNSLAQVPEEATHQVHAMLVTNDIVEPANFQEAVSGKYAQKWKDAILAEFEAHEKNGTWKIVPKPERKSLLSTKWVFKVKTLPNGQIDRFKARLVARGFEQRAGLDFFETYSPVARYDSIRTLIAIAAQRKLKIKQFDITTAFLYGTLEEDIYIKAPQGLTIQDNQALKLVKGLYGLKQSPRVWSNEFKSKIAAIGFAPTRSDGCVFRHLSKQIFVCIYVDDGLVLAEDADDINEVLNALKRAFDVKLVTGNTFVGLEIIATKTGYFMHQKSFAEKILDKFGKENCTIVSTPLATNHNINEPADEDEPCNNPYRAAIGSLLFLASNTRPDLMHSIALLSKFNNKPKSRHWDAVQRVLRYLRGSIHKGILYEYKPTMTIEVYTDADWAADATNRKSITGTLITLAGGPVIFRSNQQSLVSLSTTEAEYIAAAETVRDLVWIKSLLNDLGVSFDTPRVLCDSKSAIGLIRNQEFSRRTKHIDTKYHFISDHYNKKCFKLEYIETDRQLADYFTKAIPREQFDKLITKSNILSLESVRSQGEC